MCYRAESNLGTSFWDELKDPEEVSPGHHQVPLPLPEEGAVEAVLYTRGGVARTD
jgi:hypothetical protein